MHIGKSYGLTEFVHWTRRKIYVLITVSVLPVALYQLGGWHWLAIPWPVVAMLGTAASFIVGFKNAQTYNRTIEAQQIWGAIASSSRYWGLISRDFLSNLEKSHTLIYRHLAWLTALRNQLRGKRIWESAAHKYNFEYRRQVYDVPEHEVALGSELQKFLPPHVLAKSHPPGTRRRP